MWAPSERMPWGGTITVWINPRDPSEAVVLRDLRWSEIGLLVSFGLLLVWISLIFLLNIDMHAANPGFSWRTVSVMLAVGAYMGVLVPLLWRDGHPIWAVIAAAPLLLAINGTVHGLRQ